MNNEFELTDMEDQRHALQQDSEKFLLALEDQLSSLSKEAKKVGTLTLVVGGGLFLGYLIAKNLFPSKKKKIKKVEVIADTPNTIMVKQPKEESPIVKMIKEQITLFLMAVLKEKLSALIKVTNQNK